MTFSWSISPSPIATALSTTLSYQPAGGGWTYVNNPTSPYTMSVASVWYNWGISAQATCYDPYSGIYFSNQFYGGCTNTIVQGHVEVAGSSDPVDGASVQVDMTGQAPWTGTTGLDGSYSADEGCGAQGQTTVTAYALGFNTGPGQNSASGTATAYSTTTVDDPLQVRSTADTSLFDSGSPTTAYAYDVNDMMSSVTFTTGYSSSSAWASNINCASISNTGGSASCANWISQPANIPQPPSDNNHSELIQVAGTDVSTSTSPSSYLYFPLLGLPSPWAYYGLTGSAFLSSPIDLAFNVYVPSSGNAPNSETHFGVDAMLTNGNELDSYPDSLGNEPMNSLGQPCAAPLNTIPRDQWVQLTCDLSEMRDVSVNYFWLVFDNGGNYGSGAFVAYFDSVRLENAMYPQGLVDGNFELLHPYGWNGGKQPGISVAAFPKDGAQSLVINPPNTCGTECPNTETIFQVFRVPSNIPALTGSPTDTQLDLQLTGWVYVVSSCIPGCPGSGTSATIYLSDRTAYDLGTASSMVSLGTIQASSSPSWQSLSIDLTPFYGHVIWLYLSATRGSLDTTGYAYFDKIQILPNTQTQTTLSEAGLQYGQGTTNGMFWNTSSETASLRLPNTYYNPYCSGNPQQGSIPESFSLEDKSDMYTIWTNTPPGSGTTLGPFSQDNLTLAINTRTYNPGCAPNADDTLDFGVQVETNGTGPITANPPGTYSGTEYVAVGMVCLSVQEIARSGYPIPLNPNNQPYYPAWNGPTGVDGWIGNTLTIGSFAEFILATASAVAMAALGLLEGWGARALSGGDAVYENLINFGLSVAQGMLGITKSVAPQTNPCTSGTGVIAAQWGQTPTGSYGGYTSYTTMAVVSTGAEAFVMETGLGGGNYRLIFTALAVYCLEINPGSGGINSYCNWDSQIQETFELDINST